MTASSSRAALAAVVTLAAAVLTAATATGVAGAAPNAPNAAGSTVTLITGDQVVLNGARFGSIKAGPGRADIGFHTFHRDGRLHVIPRDAVKAVANGKLDLRLFDVTGLVEAGYDDAKRDTLPLVVTQHGHASLRSSGTQVTRALPAVNAVAARTAKTEAATAFQTLLNDPGVKKVWLDGVRRPSLDRSTAQIGAPTAWQAGYTGQGVKVAVLDTGVDDKHPDLVGKEIAQQNFTTDPDSADVVGHGTHVAATIAGSDAKYKGVAPDAQILDGKVCIDQGCAESSILGGMQWAVDQGADVVNLSLGGTDSPEIDPLEEAVNTLSAQSGTLFVIAAGNSGGPGTVGSPGSADAALTVGAVNRDDSIASFSSRGPRVGDGAVKPDITAPGVDIVAAKSSTGQVGTPVDDNHVALSGTSMATPHVAGAAALIAQQHPDWTGAQIKAALMASAKNNPALTAFDQGTGRVDLAKAITTTVTTEPASLVLGFQQWPHDDDTPVTKELTYHNSGTEPVTLPVSLDAKGPDGKPAPAGMFTVSPATVTIPAGGEAKVTVTANTKAGTVDGLFAGAVVAGDVVRTPVSVDREVESYDITATFLDANGQAPTRYSGMVMGVDNNTFTFLEDTDNSATTRLPKGEYMVYADIVTGDPQEGRNAVLVQPSLTVTGTAALTFDARTAQSFKITAPGPGAVPVIAEFSIVRTYQGASTMFGMPFFGGFPEGMTLGHVGPTLPEDELAVLIASQAQGTPIGTTPVNYRFAWLEHGRVPTGFTRTPTTRDLAEVRTKIGPAPAGHEFMLGAAPITPDERFTWGALLPVPGGDEAVDYVTADDVRWHWLMSQSEGMSGKADYSIDERSYLKGRTYEERFNFPVFGPGLPASRYEYLGRLGDVIQVFVPLVNDGANNLGGSAYSSARTTLYRDGQKIGETTNPGGRFTVPAGAAGYRAELDFVRAPGVSEFTSRVTGAWTFRSDTVPGEQSRKLPISVVRFTPELDANGGTRAGRVLRIPLTVAQQQGADNGRVRKVEIDVSFDDGKTWSKVPVVGGAAFVRNTAQPGYASLRAKGSDSKGNTFEHSVIRAYKIV
ncbi:peptidase S8 [Saccharothrix sp. ALI-22-I]|nr:S8 family serine peptidase [Saccharothrix sp. ALI-22-I]ONI92392.1 peptidase S8 [Saccharothrix sp. ALI-22-I]